MIWQLDLILPTLLLICALGALTVKDLFSTAVILSAYSFFMCILLVGMGAVDVGFTEATVGAGVSTVLFVAAITHITRRTKD